MSNYKGSVPVGRVFGLKIGGTDLQVKVDRYRVLAAYILIMEFLGQ